MVQKIFTRLLKSNKKTHSTASQNVEVQNASIQRECRSCHSSFDEEVLLKEHFCICPQCGNYFRLSAKERFFILFDEGHYEDVGMQTAFHDPLSFPDYKKKFDKNRDTTEIDEAVSVAYGSIMKRPVVAAAMSFSFVGGSMGVAVGERIVQAMFLAVNKRCPCVLVTASGGARMYEGIFSLMQMARTAHAAAIMEMQGIPLFILLTDPTTGGVTASFAMLGDVIMAESHSLIGFAGPRVIEGTIKQDLPEGFQSAEFQQEHGFVDLVVPRKNICKVLAYLIDAHMMGKKHE